MFENVLTFGGKSNIIYLIMELILKRVFICSEYQGLETNLSRARVFCEYASKRKYAVFAPHMFYPQFLDEFDPKDRATGLESGCSWLNVAHEMWVFVRNGKLSDGMSLEIGRALIYKVKIRYFDYCDETGKITEMRHVDTSKVPKQKELIMPKPFAKESLKSLQNVATALSKGVRYEDLQEELDKVLGPSETNRDEQLDAEWEEQYRNQD